MLTIIIPYYKIAFFKETLQSLENQTYKNFKLFIGDDNSPENPEIFIRETIKTIPFVYKKYTDNFGGKNLIKQWERVIADSNAGEWFMILGDDDMISANFVETFYNKTSEIEKEQSNVIKFSQCWIDETGKQINDFSAYQQLIPPIENWKYKFIEGHRGSLSEHIFRKTAYHKHHFKNFPLAWGSDDYAVLEFSENKNIFFINEAKVYVRISDQSISGSNAGAKEKAFALYHFFGLILNNYCTNLPKGYILRKTQDQIDFAYQQKVKLNINLLKIYLYLGEFKKFLKIPITFYHLSKK